MWLFNIIKKRSKSNFSEEKAKDLQRIEQEREEQERIATENAKRDSDLLLFKEQKIRQKQEEAESKSLIVKLSIYLLDSLTNNNSEKITDDFNKFREEFKQYENLQDIEPSIFLTECLYLFMLKRKFSSEKSNCIWLERALYIAYRQYSDSLICQEKRMEALMMFGILINRKAQYARDIMLNSLRGNDRLHAVESMNVSKETVEKMQNNLISVTLFVIDSIKDYLDDVNITESIRATAKEWSENWMQNSIINKNRNPNDYKKYNSDEILGRIFYYLNLKCNKQARLTIKNRILDNTTYFQGDFLAYDTLNNVHASDSTQAVIELIPSNEEINVNINGLNEDLIAGKVSWDKSFISFNPDILTFKFSYPWGSRHITKTVPTEMQVYIDNGEITTIVFNGITKEGSLFCFQVHGHEIK